MHIYVDADACPVKEIIIEETFKKNIPVTFVASYAHFSKKEYPDHINIVWVDSGSDQADFKIMQLAKERDLVVTQDYGLASMLLSKGCIVLHHAGYEYTEDNINTLITSRHLSAVARKKTGRVSSGRTISPFSEEEQHDFKHLLREKLQKK